MKLSWFLAAVAALGSAQCARNEAAPAPAPAARVAPTEDARAVGEAAQDGPRAEAPARNAAPSFQSLGDGLSVLSDERIDAEGDAHEWIIARIDLQRRRLRVRARSQINPIAAKPLAVTLRHRHPGDPTIVPIPIIFLQR